MISYCIYIAGNVYKLHNISTFLFLFFLRFKNAMLKSICEVLDLERSGVNSELVKRILNFLMHPKPSGKVSTILYYFSNKSIINSLSLVSLFCGTILLALLSTFKEYICVPLTYLQRCHDRNNIEDLWICSPSSDIKDIRLRKIVIN